MHLSANSDSWHLSGAMQAQRLRCERQSASFLWLHWHDLGKRGELKDDERAKEALFGFVKALISIESSFCSQVIGGPITGPTGTYVT